jgi:hypothetical protein
VKASRRELIAGGSCAVLIATAPGLALATRGSRRRLFTDDADTAEGTAAVLLPPGRFVDDALIAVLPAGGYRGRLSPANAMLLLEVLRTRRVAVGEDGDGGLLFTIGRRA